MKADKNILQSKTYWVNVLLALAVAFPGAGELISQNPEIVSWGFVAINLILRRISSGKVTLLP